MPLVRHSACSFLLVAMLLGPTACSADQGGARAQTGDSPGPSDPPSASGEVAGLREQLASDDPVIRSAAAGSLIAMRTEEARQAIEAVLQGGKEPAVIDLLKVIGARREARLLPMVVQRLRGTTDGIVAATFACLDCFERDRVADEVVSALGRPDLGGSETARLAEALGRTRQKKAVPKLIELFAIPDPVVHDRAVAALFLVTGFRFHTREEWSAWWTASQEQSREDWLEKAHRDAQGDPESDFGAELARTRIELLTLKLSQAPVDPPDARLAIVREAIQYRYAPQVRVFGAGEAAKLPVAARGKALEVLLAQARQDPSDDARAAAFDAIGQIAAGAGVAEGPQREAAAVLGAAATGDSSARVRVAAIGGLARLPAPVAVDKIRQTLVDPDRSVQVAAVGSLGRIRSEEAVQELMRLLPGRAGEPELGKAIVDALGDAGAAEAVPMLVDLLEGAGADEARPLRWSIANSLAKIKSKDGLAALLRLGRDRFLDVRVRAIQGIGAAGGAEQVPTLIDVLKGPERDAKERSAAALALGQIADPAAQPALLAALAGDPAVAPDAWKALLLVVGSDRPRAVALARELVQAQDWARAVEVLDPAARDAALEKDAPGVALEARDLLGVALLGAGRGADALPYLKGTAERADASDEARGRFLSALRDLKRLDEALAVMEPWIAQAAGGGARWELLVRRVELLRDARRFQEGAAAAERLAAEAGVPDDVRTQAGRLRDECRKAADAAGDEGADRSRVIRLVDALAGDEKASRTAAMDELARLGRKAVPALLDLADGDDPARWGPSSEALSAITRLSHPLDAGSSKEARKKAVDDWRAWYERE